MHRSHRVSRGSPVLVALLLLACGGGAGTPGDTLPSTPADTAASGLDRFLQFPNPQLQPDGRSQIDSTTYAQAYYAAIDPSNSRDTLDKWKAANGFDSGSGEQVTVVFGDRRDLGYGRRMTGRQNPDGTIAFLVENYLTNPGGSYALSLLSLQAAVAQDSRWRVGFNAIEFSPAPVGGAAFAKFFSFDPGTGARGLTVDLDGRGEKAMPGVCITCHGGRGDALTPPDPATGLPRFNLVQNTASNRRGDVQARLQPFEVDSFAFPAQTGFTRSEQEAALKRLNQFVLCSYPVPVDDPVALPAGACAQPRRAALPGEWQGGAARLVRAAYGGDGLPQVVYADSFVPDDWVSHGQETLYREVVATSCRMCHMLRGTRGQSDIDLQGLAAFEDYADRIKAHAVDRGNMPLARIVSDAFARSSGPELLATFLESRQLVVRDAAGTALRPGRPVADPGPDRVVRPGTTPLSAAGSLFADGYEWSIVSGPAGATLGPANVAQPVFSAAADGHYVLRLVVRRAALASAPADLKITVDSMLAIAPLDIRFAHIQADMQVLGSCVTCHRPGTAQVPPVFFDGVDAALLHAEVRSRINFTDIAASPLLRKPAGRHHGGGIQPGFDTSLEPGEPGRARYDRYLNWILNGAPP